MKEVTSKRDQVRRERSEEVRKVHKQHIDKKYKQVASALIEVVTSALARSFDVLNKLVEGGREKGAQSKNLTIRCLTLASAFLASGTGCASLKDLPLPPTYNDRCEPSSTIYLEWAMDTQDLAKAGEIPANPVHAVEKALRLIDESGWKIVEKASVGQDKLDRFTTTSAKHIFVKPGFFKQGSESQAKTLWHELVHIRQWQRLGRGKMGARWAIYAEGRWALETVAYRESFRVMSIFGASEQMLRTYAPKRANSFYEEYQLSGMNKKCMIELTTHVWTTDLPTQTHIQLPRIPRYTVKDFVFFPLTGSVTLAKVCVLPTGPKGPERLSNTT